MNPDDHDHRLEEAAAFALGSLDADQIDDFKAHLQDCKRCQEELRWLAPAVRALPEAVERADAAAGAERAADDRGPRRRRGRGEARREGRAPRARRLARRASASGCADFISAG